MIVGGRTSSQPPHGEGYRVSVYGNNHLDLIWGFGRMGGIARDGKRRRIGGGYRGGDRGCGLGRIYHAFLWAERRERIRSV